MYRKTKLACSVAAVLASAISANSAFAQDAQPNKDVEVIEVSGIRSSVAKSMDVKRSSAGVVDAISAEDIGDFPDTNLAESLQRITGVSIDRSGGEGQLITVRGFGPQFNTVLVNGRQMASENDSRAFSFDTIASELVSSLDVHKTSTATMQSGGVGSTININTARPFALNGFKMAGSVKGVYDENSEETTPQFSGLISNTFNDDTFGVLLAVSHQERETRLNQAQMDGWLENVGVPNPVTQSGDAWTGNVFSPRNYDHKVTFEERTRTNANLVFQYAPNDKLVVTADALYSDFDVESEATSYGHWFTAPNIQGVGDDGSLFDENGNRRSPTVDANGTIVDLYQEVGLATDMHAKTFDRLTDTYAVGLNFDYQYSENLNLSFDLSHSEAEREANNGGGDQLSLIGYANRVRFQVDDNILPVASMFASPNANIYSGQQELDGAIVTGPDGFPIYNPALTPDGVSNHLDEANSRAHVMLRRGWAVEDEVSQLRFDGEYVTDGSGLTEIRFGAQYSTETKSLTRWDNEGVGIHCTYCGYPDLPEIPAGSQYVFDAGSDFLSDVSGSGRMPTSWLAHDGEANFAFLESYYQSVNGESISFDAVRRNNSFEVEEDIISTYMEFDFEGEVADMFLSATAGVRYEMTDVTVNGTQAPITGLTILDQTEMLAGFGDAQSIATESDYDVLLPNFSVRLEITDDLIARFAASSTITRPTLNSMSPVTVITTTRQGGDLTSTSGNPALEPFKSDNLDLSLEYYYDEASYASIGYFRKLVSNFIVNSQEDKTFELADGSLLTDPSTGTNASAPDAGDDVAVFTNTLPNNGEDATVDGFELALQHTFDNGFGVLANGTIVDSDAELDPFDINQVFALTGLSDSYNLVAFYETDDYQIRLAYNWRDEFVQSLTQGQGDGPTIVESYQQLDISGSYSVTDNVEIFF
ncbi:MAG: TonB-dependent receptor, partial [Pseudomonadota bacterium]|nr:TonB-dependent receptor [Pseudomonadota bacterium]